MADNTKRISEIDSILESGLAETTVDGVTVKYDLDSLRRERQRLMAEDDSQRSRRPRASTIRLGGW